MIVLIRLLYVGMSVKFTLGQSIFMYDTYVKTDSYREVFIGIILTS